MLHSLVVHVNVKLRMLRALNNDFPKLRTHLQRKLEPSDALTFLFFRGNLNKKHAISLQDEALNMKHFLVGYLSIHLSRVQK